MNLEKELNRRMQELKEYRDYTRQLADRYNENNFLQTSLKETEAAINELKFVLNRIAENKDE